MAQAREPRPLATKTMATSTPTAIAVMTHVLPAPSDRAAPGLPMSLSRMNSPMNGRGSPSASASRAIALLTWSVT